MRNSTTLLVHPQPDDDAPLFMKAAGLTNADIEFVYVPSESIIRSFPRL